MDFSLPELGEGVYEAELVSWLVRPGDRVKRGQSLMEVLTDKATMEVPAPFVGTVTGLLAEPGQKIKVGDHVLSYSGGAAAEPPANDQPPREPARAAAAVAPAPGPRRAGSVRAAPSVRYMARKLGIDLETVAGSGPSGRILIEDLAPRMYAAARGNDRPLEKPADYGTPGTRIKLRGLRGKIAEHMVRSKQAIPHYAYVDECEVTDLVRLRESLKETYARAGIRLTYLPFLVRAAAAALREVPLVNGSLDEKAGEIVLHDRYHVGIAVATPGGLIVPVIHDADKKDLTQLAREIERLSADARAGKSRLEDLRGGTFTITSIGGIGGLISTPIINHPEAAILGVGKIVRRPAFDDRGGIRPADLLYLSFSFDHRILDGAIGAAFGNAVCRRLQNPAALLLPEHLR